MEKHLEIEYKTRINPEDQHIIFDYFPFSEPIFQENRYYDTENQDLFKKGIMCRTRKIKDHVVLTVKVPQDFGIMEYEATVVGTIYDCGNVQIVLDEFNLKGSDLVEITFSNTVRYEYKDAFGTWCLDITQFEHHRDFELEYELYHDEDQAEKHYYSTLKSIGIEFEEIDPKFVRALNSKDLKDVPSSNQD